MELWKTIPGWESYEASSLGRIRSIDRWVEYVDGRRCFYYSKVLKHRVGKHKYFYVFLCDGKQHQFNCSVHSLVCAAFHGSCPTGLECRHLDGINIHNTPQNLKWGTRRENKADSIRHGTNNTNKGRKLLNSKISALKRWKSKRARNQQSIRIKAAWKRIKA